MKNILAAAIIILLISASCKQGGNSGSDINMDSIDLSDRDGLLSELDTIGAGIPIFYNMYLSVELSSMFETAGAVYNREILNNPDNLSDYITSYKKALNLGVYAVDLSYSRVFEQYEEAASFFTAMQKLSTELGIPSTYFENTAQRLEKNLTDKDSLIVIANEVYYDTEDYLKENERFATASVIILGGWVEAVYIGTEVVIESKSTDIMERLMDQKYSISNLMVMLSDHKDNEVVASYIKKLEDLQKVYMEMNIEIPANYDANAEGADALMTDWLSQIETLRAAVLKVRNDIVL